jgi:hypothetical protein
MLTVPPVSMRVIPLNCATEFCNFRTLRRLISSSHDWCVERDRDGGGAVMVMQCGTCREHLARLQCKAHRESFIADR